MLCNPHSLPNVSDSMYSCYVTPTLCLMFQARCKLGQKVSLMVKHVSGERLAGAHISFVQQTLDGSGGGMYAFHQTNAYTGIINCSALGMADTEETSPAKKYTSTCNYTLFIRPLQFHLNEDDSCQSDGNSCQSDQNYSTMLISDYF